MSRDNWDILAERWPILTWIFWHFLQCRLNFFLSKNILLDIYFHNKSLQVIKKHPKVIKIDLKQTLVGPRKEATSHPSAEHWNNSKFRHPKNLTMVLESLNKTNEPMKIKKIFDGGLMCKSSICPSAWVKMRRIQNRTALC